MHADEPQPLFKEYLSLAENGGWGAVVHTSPLKVDAGDCLVVVDMQNDFIPVDDQNPRGGAFGVAEGGDIVSLVTRLMEEFATAGALVVATRDYHPKNHCSFIQEKGHFPSHCIQGSVGSYFYPSIGETLHTQRKAGRRVSVAFKGFHEDADSFGSFCYADEEASWSRLGHRKCEERLLHGCTLAAWTGSVILDCSNLEDDINAPPDILAAHRRVTLAEHLKQNKIKRVFACGLAMDFCVLDTCLNGVQAGFTESYLLMDATRAAYVPGLGQIGTGFLSCPAEIKEKLVRNHVRVCPSSCVLPSLKVLDPLLDLTAPMPKFPFKLGPFALAWATKLKLTVQRNTYTVTSRWPKDVLAMIVDGVPVPQTGYCTESVPLTLDAATRKNLGIPADTTKFAWGHPAGSGSYHDRQHAYLPTTSRAASFFVCGGFLYLSDSGDVLGVSALTVGTGLDFAVPAAIPEDLLQQLKKETPSACSTCKTPLEAGANFCGNCGAFLHADRWQPVSIPPMKAEGAKWCSWWNPGESVKTPDGKVHNIGGSHGAFAYLFSKDPMLHHPNNRIFQAREVTDSHSHYNDQESDDHDIIATLARHLRTYQVMDKVQTKFQQQTFTEAEFVDGIKSIVSWPDEKLKRVFGIVDQNKDGVISLAKLTAVLLAAK